MLLCGADLIKTFFEPHVWEDSHVRLIAHCILMKF